MKFDRKYGAKGSTLAAAAAAADSETEPEVSEDAVTPSRIASELEDKVRFCGATARIADTVFHIN